MDDAVNDADPFEEGQIVQPVYESIPAPRQGVSPFVWIIITINIALVGIAGYLIANKASENKPNFNENQATQNQNNPSNTTPPDRNSPLPPRNNTSPSNNNTTQPPVNTPPQPNPNTTWPKKL